MAIDRAKVIRELVDGMAAHNALARSLGLDFLTILRTDVLHMHYTTAQGLTRLLDAVEDEYAPADGATLN